jgi:hypothetical protein
LAEAGTLRQAMDIREYVRSVGKLCEQGEVSIPSNEVESWSRWALDQADRIDPVHSQQFLDSMKEGA